MQTLFAQTADPLFLSESRIDTLRKGQLSLEMDNLSFFKNNEFNSTIQKGYTLPGFWLQLKASYYPFSNLKIEGGIHSIWFWGSSRYPAFAYKGISTWNGQDYARNVHFLPYFRAQIALSKQVDFVLGDIYGGSNHRLIEPLYNPELNLTSDPESGLQFLYHSKWLQFDMWVDWMTYIYKLDTQQEAFVSGASARLMANAPESPFHVYFQLQGLLQHRGGEIDITNEEVQTLFNGATGLGITGNIHRKVLKQINAEVDLAAYRSPRGGVYPMKDGVGYYTKLALQLADFNVKASYWSCRNFMPVFGSAFYGSASTREGGLFYEKPKMLYLGVDYMHLLKKGFAFGIKAETYYYLSGKMYHPQTGLYVSPAFGRNTNYSIGVCLRINPSFLLKQYSSPY
jgi:hypothetical protein